MTAALNLRIGSPVGISQNLATNFNNFSLDATTDKVAFAFQTSEAATITKIGFRYGARTGTPPTYIISIQGLSSTTANPDGTIKGGGTPASATFTPPADTTWNGTWQWVTLSNSYAAVRGEELSIVIEYSSGTVDASNFSSFTTTTDCFDERIGGFPYALSSTGSYTAIATAQAVWGYQTSSRTFGFPVISITQTQYSSDSTPDEYGMAFTLPSGWGDTFKLKGVRFIGRTPATNKTITMSIYSGVTGAALLEAVTITRDKYATLGSGQRSHEWFFDKASLDTLSFGTEYVVSFTCGGTSTAFVLNTVDFQSSGDMDSIPLGTNAHLVTRTDAAANFTRDQTKRPMLELIIDDITEPAGGGGGLATSIFGGSVIR